MTLRHTESENPLHVAFKYKDESCGKMRFDMTGEFVQLALEPIRPTNTLP